MYSCTVCIYNISLPRYIHGRGIIDRFVIPRKDSVILAEKIIGLSKNKELRHKFGERNLKIAKKKVDINENFKNLEAMYNKLVV